jgi:hypothetical protein
MNTEQLTTTVPERESRRTEAEFKAVAKKLGHIVVFRVMSLDDHSGVVEVDDSGRITYIVDNSHYPDQGDFAFSGDRAFDTAVTRAYPNYLKRVHAVRVPESDVVEPFPDEAPGLVFIKNGAKAQAVKIPIELVDEHIDRSDAEKDDPKVTQEVIDKLFGDKN